MNIDEHLVRHSLPDGTPIEIRDATSHYFGGYYHVRLDLRGDIRIRAEWFDDREAFDQACRRLGSVVPFRRSLDRMAVAEADLENVRHVLLQTFEKNVLTYLMRPDFCKRYVLAELARSLRSAPASRIYHRV